MYGTLFDARNRQFILGRVSRLTPESPRRWGTLTVGRAVVHMADQLRMAFGEIKASTPYGPLRFAALRYLSIHVIPWPKGRIKAPGDAFRNSPTELAADAEQLRTLIERFGAQSPDAQWPQHAMFGQLTGKDWGVLAYRHLNHHLTQFSA
jgi:uncharacterized protein DUF1569